MATKRQKAKVKKVMGEFKEGTLHSGSKTGPKVTNRKQAIAIALKDADLSRKDLARARSRHRKKRKKP